MKILFVTQESGKVPSGVVTVVSELCNIWPNSDNISILMNRKHWAKGQFSDTLKGRLNSQVFTFPFFLRGDIARPLRVFFPFFSFMYILWIAYWLRCNKIECVLSHNGGWPGGELNRLVIYAAFMAGIKRRCMVIHNTPNIPQGRIKILLLRFKNWILGRTASQIITVSNACAQTLISESDFGVELKVIYNGINTQVSKIDSFKSNVKVRSVPVIGFVGELDSRKGVHVLIEALFKVKTTCRLVIIGNGDQEYVDQLMLAASKSPWKVEFMGFRSDLYKLYPLMDIVVLPSLKFESFGMVLVEAMLHNLPVICSDFGGMKEVVEHGKSGLVTVAGDSQALAQALNLMLNDRDLRMKMGLNGNNRLKKHFSSSVMTFNYFALLHESD